MPPDDAPAAIVGIGASAGGLEAFSTLLRSLPVDTGMAFVLVQHLDPHHQSILPELLAGRTRMPVVQVTDNTAVRPNHVYVIPPNTTMVISGGVLHLSPRGPSERHMPIDTFFASLAEDQMHNSIGVVLSGVASDGTLGLRAIKAEGGITFAQDETASFDGMPHSAVHMGVVDSVLPPDRIAAELAAIAHHPFQSGETGLAVADGSAMQKLFALLRTSRGIDFSQYKQPTVQRRLARRMVLMKADDPAQYLEILRQTPSEVEALFNDLLINVTEFFRDPPVFEALKETAFPTILKERQVREQPVRIWVPGCSTGEEVYSIAISLAEYLESNGRDDAVQIFATDVSQAAIDKARAGVYPKEAAAPVSPERLGRFFTRVDSGYQISRAIREMCIFSLQNITKDPPLSRMDLVSCRNLLIYLGSHLQRRVLSIFLYALQPNGCLLLGNSETPGAVPDLFVALDQANKIFRRKLTAAPPAFDLPSRLASFPPFTATPDPTAGEARRAPELPAGLVVQRFVDRMLLAQYAPPGLLVDNHLRIVEFRGEVRPYLGPSAGEADLDLFKMLREELGLQVRAALDEARRKNAGIRLENIAIRDLGQSRQVTVAVTPILALPAGSHYLVLFEEQRTPPARLPRETGEPPAPVQDARGQIARLEEELSSTKQYLQTIIEELRSANEEAQSSNEELQSSNEELQTAKEELQSSNEELTTLNTEIQGRSEELGQLNNDLVNLLSSLNVPIVMMDGNLRIRRFTPVAERVLNLIATDVGRPISDLRPRINAPNLEKILRNVIETLAPHEQEVQDQEGRWYSMRIRPYRTVENRIEGAVLQLVDVTEIKRSLEEVRQARDYAEAVTDTVREPLAVLGPELRIEAANHAFYQMFELSPEASASHSIFEVGGGLWDSPQLRQLLENLVSAGKRFEDLEIEHDFRGIGRKTMLLNARHIEQEGRAGRILLAFEDITERKRAAEARYRRLFESAKDAILIVDALSGEFTDANPFAEQLFGYSRAELVGGKLWDAGPLRVLPEAQDLIARLSEQGVVGFFDISLTAHDGSRVQVEAVANVYDEGGRKMIQFNLRDITERKRFERELEHTQKLESLGLLAGGIAHDFNNLLTTILGNASLALAGMEGDAPTRILLGQIVRASERAANLTRQMLAYAGKGRLTTEPIDLNELIGEVSVLIRSSLPKIVELNFDLKGDLPFIEGDPGQIQQILMNLMINGGEAIERGQPGSVTVRTEVREFTADQLSKCIEGEGLASGRYVSLEVVDTGSGMDEATKSRIFDPFFTTKFTGRGLGLAAVLGIIRSHHGAIRVDTRLGRGTSFQVLLPAAASRPEPRPAIPRSRSLAGTGTVLVVDDEEALRLLAKAGLERNGYQVILAENGAAGVQIFRERHEEISLVVLDKTMPVMGGGEALEQMRAIDADVPVILSSGYDQASTLEHVAGSHLAGFVQKPYTIEALLEAIQKALSWRLH